MFQAYMDPHHRLSPPALSVYSDGLSSASSYPSKIHRLLDRVTSAMDDLSPSLSGNEGEELIRLQLKLLERQYKLFDEAVGDADNKDEFLAGVEFRQEVDTVLKLCPLLQMQAARMLSKPEADERLHRAILATDSKQYLTSSTGSRLNTLLFVKMLP